MMLGDVVIGSRISEVDVNMPNGCSIAMSNIQAMQKTDNIEVIQTYDLSFHLNVVWLAVTWKTFERTHKPFLAS